MSSVIQPATLARAERSFRRLILGSASFHQNCLLGLKAPQKEVSVLLEGVGTDVDVTQNNVMAAARPLTIAIGLERKYGPGEIRRRRPVLKFTEAGNKKRKLGEIRLRITDTITIGTQQLCLF